MKVTIDKIDTSIYNKNVSLQCPHCGHYGTFLSLVSGVNDIVVQDFLRGNFSLGIRRCPRDKCRGHLFFITDHSNELIFTSPSEIIPFNTDNIPKQIVNAFQEAIICHSNNCFIASAIMIRKTLEEICDERKAEGKNLFSRLKDLSAKILIPKELIDAMDELRLLGNDAAHIEAQTFNEVGKNEIEISIEFTKEILKAVYQYESLLSKLRSLKADPPKL
ncbi:DUF4145 domain-containing protein [Chryseobacterium sp. C3]|uniref:DUF4145 domain-containing protein n=1 Tax=Chryseobacterium sp. C3 TaxID=2761532 RepID=UPI00162908FA|nr:DUF4145 domain-containing protein [Chryseobacterium sp. C3]